MNFKARFERKASAPEVTDADIVVGETVKSTLAGYCSEEQWSRWFNEPTANTEALTMGGQA